MPQVCINASSFNKKNKNPFLPKKACTPTYHIDRDSRSTSDSVKYSPSSSDTDSCWLSSTSSSDKDSSCSATPSDSGMVSWSSGANCGSVSSSSSDVSATY